VLGLLKHVLEADSPEYNEWHKTIAAHTVVNLTTAETSAEMMRSGVIASVINLVSTCEIETKEQILPLLVCASDFFSLPPREVLVAEDIDEEEPDEFLSAARLRPEGHVEVEALRALVNFVKVGLTDPEMVSG
jgi:hypothetical protein